MMPLEEGAGGSALAARRPAHRVPGLAPIYLFRRSGAATPSPAAGARGRGAGNSPGSPREALVSHGITATFLRTLERLPAFPRGAGCCPAEGLRRDLLDLASRSRSDLHLAGPGGDAHGPCAPT